MAGGDAAIHLDHLTRDPVAVAAGQKDRRSRHVRRRPETGEGRVLHPGGIQRAVLVRGRVLGNRHGSRGDAVDLDVVIAQIEGGAAGEVEDSRLGGFVEGAVVGPAQSMDRRHGDDLAAALGLHGLGADADRQVGSDEVCPNQFLKLFHAGFQQRFGQTVAGIGHDDVQAAEALQRRIHHGLDLVLLGDVSLDQEALPAEAIHQVGRLLPPRPVTVVIHDAVGALRSEGPADARTQSPGRPRHQRHLVLESHASLPAIHLK